MRNQTRHTPHTHQRRNTHRKLVGRECHHQHSQDGCQHRSQHQTQWRYELGKGRDIENHADAAAANEEILHAQHSKVDAGKAHSIQLGDANHIVGKDIDNV